MQKRKKKILIIDEARFCKVCSAILEFVGYDVETLHKEQGGSSTLKKKNYDLVITSYPYGHFMIDEIRKQKIPAIMLSDKIDGNLIEVLEGFGNSYCMIKPIDYDKFTDLVNTAMGDEMKRHGGFSIV